MNALPFAEDSLAHDPAFSAFTFIGFYLECVLVATVFYAVLRVVVFLRRPIRLPSGSQRSRRLGGETYEEALAEVKSAIRFHIETFGNDAFENDDIMETFVAEVGIQV